MRVLYDSQKFDEQTVGGATRYWHELIQSLTNLPGYEPVVALRHTANVYAGSMVGRPYFWQRRQANRRFSVQLLKRGDFDVFHPTDYDPYFLASIGGKPYVVTVLDMIHERLPQFFSPRDLTRAWKSQVVRRAAAVVAISQYTKRDLVELIGVDPEKVRVVPLASSFATVAAKVVPDAPARFVLYVGQRGKYKNFTWLVRAIAPLLRDDQALSLVCAGGGPWHAGERRLMATSGIADQVRQYDVSDGQLAFLYRRAMALVYPSLYEGFGLPLMEAFACGCPVVASQAGALPEVGEGAALYFAPTDAVGLQQALSSVVNDEAVRNSRRVAGQRRAAQFSWPQVARQTAAVYERVA
ncbi:MAG: glycosyltransferase family 4 protein [Candidatus Andersenbacteria bacterium]|nr:glycosyltransferase family 4 protein [Candidatus Andersenbacteria bacterium]